MLNSWMDTNGQELDSSDLLIIYDLQGFYHEAFGDMSSEPDETHDEVAAHAKMIGVGAKEFLQHPVSEIMLHLKWQRIKRVFQVNLIILRTLPTLHSWSILISFQMNFAFYLLFTLCLSAVAILQTMMIIEVSDQP